MVPLGVLDSGNKGNNDESKVIFKSCEVPGPKRDAAKVKTSPGAQLCPPLVKLHTAELITPEEFTWVVRIAPKPPAGDTLVGETAQLSGVPPVKFWVINEYTFPPNIP